MKLQIDEAADALYFRLDESAIVESEEVQPGVILDFNERAQVVGIEIVGLRDRVPPVLLNSLQFERSVEGSSRVGLIRSRHEQRAVHRRGEPAEEWPMVTPMGDTRCKVS